MALIDDPVAWILLMFSKEEREGRGAFCQRFPDGDLVQSLPLVEGERIFGIYKESYFFSPVALYIVKTGNCERLPWAAICDCTTRHGDGQKKSVVTLLDGTTHEISVSDLATGWSGCISQLFHQMVERYGARPAMGPESLMNIEQFFRGLRMGSKAIPNLPEARNTAAIEETLLSLRNQPNTTDVQLILASDDPDAAVGVAVRTSLNASHFEELVEPLGTSGLVDSTAELGPRFNDFQKNERVYQLMWD
ncbi:hypothetical protein [Aeoliella sp. SH292]|uniref:hypothetical protein n=1 Tax=Aeoliella sp. SH292 TaxID=3454464 RepID=UPI003F96A244